MSFLGGFYIYRIDPTTVPIKEASDTKPQSAEITGIVLFKDIGMNGESQVIFAHFPIPTTILNIDGKKPSIEDLASFNPINEFINTRQYDTPNEDKGIYYYHPDNLAEFLRKCYVPPIPISPV